jgi:hypothetical protein
MAIIKSEYSELRTLVSHWIGEIHKDISPNGYIVENPKSIFGRKIKESTNYILSKSAELAIIRMKRASEKISWTHIISSLIFFILEHYAPLVLAIGLFVSIYWGEQKAYVIPSSKPISASAGEYAGTAINWLFTIPTIFISSTLKTTVGSDLEDLTNGGKRLIFAVAASTFIYYFLLPFTYSISHLRAYLTRRRNLHILQETFIIEFKEIMERQVLQLALPRFLKIMDRLLISTNSQQIAKTLFQIYGTDYDILYYSLFTPIETEVRKMLPSEIVRSSQSSSQILRIIMDLIRTSDEDTAKKLIEFSESIMYAPTDMVSRMRKAVGVAISMIEPVHLDQR